MNTPTHPERRSPGRRKGDLELEHARQIGRDAVRRMVIAAALSAMVTSLLWAAAVALWVLGS